MEHSALTARRALRERRVSMGLTQRQLEARSGVCKWTIWKLEGGTYGGVAQAGTLRALADALRLDMEALAPLYAYWNGKAMKKAAGGFVDTPAAREERTGMEHSQGYTIQFTGLRRQETILLTTLVDSVLKGQADDEARLDVALRLESFVLDELGRMMHPQE